MPSGVLRRLPIRRSESSIGVPCVGQLKTNMTPASAATAQTTSGRCAHHRNFSATIEDMASPFRSVAAYIPPPAGGFGLGIVSEVFGYDRSDRGLPTFEFAVCTDRPGPVRTDTGLTVIVEHGLDRLAAADLVFVMSWDDLTVEPSPEALDAIRLA